MNGDLYILNQPRDPSWFSGVSDAASTWLWQHDDLIPLLLGKIVLAVVIVAIVVWRERRHALRADAETKRIGAMEFNHCREED